VIIPTFNRPNELKNCLQSFTALDDPSGEWELIVVNDGGTEPFVSTTGKLLDNLPLKHLSIDHAGPASARNAGAKVAKGDHIAFTDDDCRVEPDWLCQFEKGFKSGQYDALGGRSLNPFPNNAVAAAWHYLIDFLYDFLTDESGNVLQLVSNNVAYRRSVFEALGGFDETFPFAGGEDTELSHRLLAKGYRQRYHPDAKLWHYHTALSPGKYIKQQFRYGRGNYRMKQALIKNHLQPIKFEPRVKTSYKRALIRSLFKSKASIPIWFLVILSQIIVDPAGQHYQKMISTKEFK